MKRFEGRSVAFDFLLARFFPSHPIIAHLNLTKDLPFCFQIRTKISQWTLSQYTKPIQMKMLRSTATCRTIYS